MKVTAYGLPQSDSERFTRYQVTTGQREASGEDPPGVGSTGVRQDDLKGTIHVDPRAIRVCCGHPIEPHLVEIRSLSTASLFVSVWRCPHCGRATS